MQAATEAEAGDEPAEARETTAMDLAVTAAELVDDETPAAAAGPADEEPQADEGDPDSAAAGPDSRA